MRPVEDSMERGATIRVAIALAALAALAALGCAGTPAYSDFDPNARFDTYRTYAWISEDGTLEAATGRQGGPQDDPLLRRRIRAAVEQQLGARGYRRADSQESADFVIAFSLGAREKIQVDSYPVGGGWYGRYGGWYATTGVSARSYTEGTLSIDVFDGESHEAVWTGWASKTITDTTDRARLVDEVVGAILSRFPPER